nr:hypothetical protein HmN_001013000 [Hymenolepis microstoma]
MTYGLKRSFAAPRFTKVQPTVSVRSVLTTDSLTPILLFWRPRLSQSEKNRRCLYQAHTSGRTAKFSWLSDGSVTKFSVTKRRLPPKGHLLVEAAGFKAADLHIGSRRTADFLPISNNTRDTNDEHVLRRRDNNRQFLQNTSNFS